MYSPLVYIHTSIFYYKVSYIHFHELIHTIDVIKVISLRLWHTMTRDTCIPFSCLFPQTKVQENTQNSLPRSCDIWQARFDLIIHYMYMHEKSMQLMFLLQRSANYWWEKVGRPRTALNHFTCNMYLYVHTKHLHVHVLTEGKKNVDC